MKRKFLYSSAKTDRVQECIFCGLLDEKCNKTTKKCSTLIICIEHVKDSVYGWKKLVKNTEIISKGRGKERRRETKREKRDTQKKERKIEK